LEFKVNNKGSLNIHKYKKDELDIAYDFSKKAIKELGNLIKGIVLFGSTARKKKGFDIDILLVIDDISVVLSKEIVEAYQIIIEKIVIKTSAKIHVTTLKFTSFYEYTMISDPISINILRDGVALYDTGFFEPMQSLLYRGKIRPTLESIWVYYNRAPVTLKNSQWHIMQAVVDLYWAVIDASHAALMKIGQVPPTPEHVADMIRTRLVSKKLVPAKYAKTVDRFYHLMKMITHGEIHNIKGEEYDAYLIEAKEFVERMKKFIEG